MNNVSKVEVRNAVIPDDLDVIRKLWLEFLVWGNAQMQEHYGQHPHNPHEAVEEDIRAIKKFQPPDGRLLLAFYEGKPCGLGSLKQINSEIGEIKRMYVNPGFRRIGAGRTILERLLLEAERIGYKKVRLDSPKFMKAAHALYRSFGFRDIGVYPEVELPAEFRKHLLFMELNLAGAERPTAMKNSTNNFTLK